MRLNQKEVSGTFNESSFSGTLTQLVSRRPEIRSEVFLSNFQSCVYSAWEGLALKFRYLTFKFTQHMSSDCQEIFT